MLKGSLFHKHRYKFLYTYFSYALVDWIYVFECRDSLCEGDCEISKTQFHGG